MDFNWLSDPHLILAAWAGVISGVMVAVLAALILSLRTATRRGEARWRAFVQQWRPALLAAVTAEDAADAPALPRLRRRDRQSFLRLWLYLHESLRGDASKRLNDAALAVQAPRWAGRLLERGSGTERVMAALALGRLQWQPAWVPLLRASRSRDALLSVTAARALVQLDPLEAARQLLPLLLGRADWDVSRVGDFLSGARQAFWLLLVRALPGAPPFQAMRGLQLARALRLVLPDTALLPMLRPDQAPAVICAALPLATSRTMTTRVAELLDHPAWPVREAAIRAMEGLALPGDQPALERRLEDPRFEVRLAAARTLSALPFVETDHLVELEEAGGTGAPVLAQVIAERSEA
ncbi:HEAT repeat domain-containing protein [Ramlibacter sp. Leaf400]|uniref:HEAT repeat domain-containing protein n=1 Tax=Ramlibacter sp. Leaf400 TaxID=1736365 RepID=UPI0006FBEA28|nr:HEAT repeat domain-containing protein [Ramlibacter sp. Leaf400]KQT07683.1 hypothetical protein ASG30_17815 [Ramlibacter sp. Leaf400]